MAQKRKREDGFEDLTNANSNVALSSLNIDLNTINLMNNFQKMDGQGDFEYKSDLADYKRMKPTTNSHSNVNKSKSSSSTTKASTANATSAGSALKKGSSFGSSGGNSSGTGGDWHACHHCSFKTKRKGDLTRHQMEVHNIGDNIQWYYCNQGDCQYNTKRKGDLNKHQKLVHDIGENIEWFICNHEGCEYKSKVKGSLKQHQMLIHNIGDSITWHHCNQPGCEYKTKLRGHLNKHQKLKHSNGGDRQWYHCSQEGCDYKAARKDHLKQHTVQVHHHGNTVIMPNAMKTNIRPGTDLGNSNRQFTVHPYSQGQPNLLPHMNNVQLPSKKTNDLSAANILNNPILSSSSQYLDQFNFTGLNYPQLGTENMDWSNCFDFFTNKLQIPNLYSKTSNIDDYISKYMETISFEKTNDDEKDGKDESSNDKETNLISVDGIGQMEMITKVYYHCNEVNCGYVTEDEGAFIKHFYSYREDQMNESKTTDKEDKNNSEDFHNMDKNIEGKGAKRQDDTDTTNELCEERKDQAKKKESISTKESNEENNLLNNDMDMFLLPRDDLEEDQHERGKSFNTSFVENEVKSNNSQIDAIDNKDIVTDRRLRAESDISKPSSETGLILAGGNEDTEEILHEEAFPSKVEGSVNSDIPMELGANFI